MDEQEKLVLMKVGRTPWDDRANIKDAYGGSCCIFAEIEPGIVYDSLGQAALDASKMSEYYLPGFHVYKVGDSEPLMRLMALGTSKDTHNV